MMEISTKHTLLKLMNPTLLERSLHIFYLMYNLINRQIYPVLNKPQSDDDVLELEDD